jgi:hypothetical protein
MMDIMNSHDPERLILGGCPLDEYDVEVEMIYRHLFSSSRKIDLEELISFCNWVFSYQFFSKSEGFKWSQNDRVDAFAKEVYNTFIERVYDK